MNIIETALPGVLVFEPKVFGDARGFFFESWHRRRYAELGLDVDFVQDNISFSARGVLRGLHFQHPRGQGKLVQVLRGEIFDVALDVRRGSPHFGQWFGEKLSSDNKKQIYIPPGFAHGFCVLSDQALISYKCTDYYAPESEVSIRWNDPAVGIAWPISEPTLSGKDDRGLNLGEVPLDRLPAYPGA